MEVNFTLDNIKAAAAELLEFAAGKKVIAFNGEMGTGKTTFIHALCEVMGVTGNVSSPTYSIINQYAATGNRVIYHLDLYRLKDEDEAINAGVEDCLYSGNTCLVEWPERAPDLFPPGSLYVTISLSGNDKRKLCTTA